MKRDSVFRDGYITFRPEAKKLLSKKYVNNYIVNIL